MGLNERVLLLGFSQSHSSFAQRRIAEVSW
jgi:hypothetical protein